MNCKQAKKISIIDYLAAIGINPAIHKNNSVWYCSPFRSEETPSFKVNINGYVWYDFGTGTGGNILKLVTMLNSTDINGALKILEQPGLIKPDFFISEQQETNQPAIEIKHVQPLQNRALIQYLNYRKISHQNAAKFVVEAYYTVNEKQYFSVAFKNDKGGFELRNKHLKNSSMPKAITTIQGNREAVNIFEGFIDFLSAMEHYKVVKTEITCIILNSVKNLNSVIDTLTGYKTINLFLDNDPSGNQAAETIKTKYPKAKDYSKIIYPGHKDFNEFICKNQYHERT